MIKILEGDAHREGFYYVLLSPGQYLHKSGAISNLVGTEGWYKSYNEALENILTYSLNQKNSANDDIMDSLRYGFFLNEKSRLPLEIDKADKTDEKDLNKNVVGDSYKGLKIDTVEWSKANHTVEQQKAICQFMINKYTMRSKGQGKDDIVKARYYTDWLESLT